MTNCSFLPLDLLILWLRDLSPNNHCFSSAVSLVSSWLKFRELDGLVSLDIIIHKYDPQIHEKEWILSVELGFIDGILPILVLSKARSETVIFFLSKDILCFENRGCLPNWKYSTCPTSPTWPWSRIKRAASHIDWKKDQLSVVEQEGTPVASQLILILPCSN